MYCPKCATNLADTATRCHGCDLDVQPIAQMLRHAHHGDAHLATQRRAVQVQRWKQQRNSWGNLLVMTSLLVGCLIPIAVGLFNNFEILGNIVVTLAGLAGLLLIGGSMLLLAADGQILATDDMPLPAADDRAPAQQSPQTGQTIRLH